MITMDFIDWLSSQTFSDPNPVFYQGPSEPTAEPNIYVVVTPVPGGGLPVEGLIEQRVFQLKLVGAQGLNSANWNAIFAEAERLARTIDRFIMNSFRPVIGGEQVVFISRFGTPIRQGGPSGDPLTSANRPIFHTMYVVEAESNIYDT